MSVRENTLIIYKLENIIEWDEKRHDDNSNGVCFVCEGKIIITNYHCISLAKHIYTEEYGELKIINVSSIYDIAILTFIDEDKFENFPNPIPLSKLNPIIPQKNEQIYFLDINDNDSKVKNLQIESVSCYGERNKKIYINCEYKEYRPGQSGSPCYNNNGDIIGLITEYNKKKNLLEIYPTIYILQIMKSSYSSTLFFNYRIIYNDLQITSSLSKKLKEDDIIHYINNEKINNGLIFCQKIQYFIDIHTYISINYKPKEKIKLSIERNNKEKNINVEAQDLERYDFIPSLFNKEYINYKNIIFVEINKEIIDYYKENNIKIMGPYFKYYNRENKKNKKIVIPIDFYNIELNNKSIINLIHNENKIRRVGTINKINKKQINNLNDMRKIIEKTKKPLNIEYEFDVDEYETIQL